jgi:hypothetical protein
MQNRLIADLIALWVAALVLAFTAFMAWGFSIHDDGIGDKIGCAVAPAILIAAGVITLLQSIGIIGVW